MEPSHAQETHITPFGTYLLVYLALMLLLGATVAAAYLDLGPIHIFVTLTIAIIKAVLVILFFMHVRTSDVLIKFFVVAGFAWLLVMMGLTLTDYLTRFGRF